MHDSPRAKASFAALAGLAVLTLTLAASPAGASLNQRTFVGPVFSVPAYYAADRIYPLTSVVTISNLLGSTETAVLSSVAVAIDYCTLKNIGGSQRVGGEVAGGPAPVLAGAADIGCGNGGSYSFPAGCLSYTSATGSIDVTTPIFLASLPSTCNSQQGTPATGDFVSEFCMSLDTLDTVSGATSHTEDTDWLALTGTSAAAYAQWIVWNEPDLNSAGWQGAGSC